MDTQDQVYRDLQKHLDKLPVGYPATHSGVEVRILKRLFTLDEANIALQLSITPEPIERIYERVKKQVVSPVQLQQILDRMEHKGTVIRTKVDRQAHYGNAMFIIGIFELQVDRLTPDFLLDVGLYMQEAFRSELFRVKTPQLRTVPIGQSISHDEKHLVSSYDDIRKVIENASNTMAIANCICRQIGDMVGRSCRTTDLRKACLIISESTAEQYIGMGIGQPATKEEVLSTLERAEEAGLVLQPLNSKQPDGICCCCGDCCGILSTVKTFPRPADYYASNYYAQVDPQLCTGCEDCIRRCQLDAPKGSDGVVTINLDRCIGCGNCVVICPANAIKLHKKAAETIPPEDTTAMHMKILSEKNR